MLIEHTDNLVASSNDAAEKIYRHRFIPVVDGQVNKEDFSAGLPGGRVDLVDCESLGKNYFCIRLADSPEGGGTGADAINRANTDNEIK